MTNPFELHTMFMVCSSLTVVAGLCMVLVQLTGQPYPGFRFWTIGVVCQGLAYSSFAYSKGLPPVLVAVGGNLFFSLHSMLYSRGLRVFAGRAPPVFPLVAALCYVAGVTYYFSAIHPSMTWRVAFLSLSTLPFYFDCARVLWRDPAFRYPIVRPWLAGAFLLLIVFAVIRLGSMFAFEPQRLEIWAPSVIQPVYMTIDTALSLSVVIGVIVLNFERAATSLKEHERLLTEDVAARKRVEAALRESELRYRLLVESSPESVVVYRGENVVYANSAAARMFGAATAQELVGRAMLDLVHPDSRSLALARRKHLADHGVGGPMAEMQFLRLNGTAVDVEIQSALVVFDGATATQVTAHDISERKRAAAEKQEFERKLQETQKLESLGVLAGGIAHDFNNILTGVLGNASLASLELPAGAPAAAQLRAITEGAQRAAELCQQMLAYSGKGSFVVRRCSLNRLVEETTHLLVASISKRATLQFDLRPDLPAFLADVTQVRQVIMNLVINASEALGEGGGVIAISTRLTPVDQAWLAAGGVIGASDVPDGNYVELEVSDSGCGMNSETLARIFDPFFTTKFAGRGLGLAAVLGIVRGHKGVLKLASDPGRGTTFKLLFPGAAGAAEIPSTPPADWRGQGEVLVVDDEVSVRRALTMMLQKLGFTVTQAGDGVEGTQVFGEGPDRFSLVFLDLTMPRMDGRQAFLELRRQRPKVCVVVMSGFSEQEAFSPFAGHETVGFLQKPFTYGDLRRVVQGLQPGAPSSG